MNTKYVTEPAGVQMSAAVPTHGAGPLRLHFVGATAGAQFVLPQEPLASGPRAAPPIDSVAAPDASEDVVGAPVCDEKTSPASAPDTPPEPDPAAAAWVPPAESTDWRLERRLLRDFDSWEIEFSTLGNGERFARAVGHIVRYAYTTETWYVYTGSRWVADASRELIQKLEVLVREKCREDAARLVEVGKGTAGERGDELRKKAKEYAGFLAANLSTPLALQKMSEAARRMYTNGAPTIDHGGVEKIAINASALDRHPHLLNFRNCVVDLRTGQCHRHDPMLLLHQQVPHCYVPGAAAPRVAKFLEEITGQSETLQRALRMTLGYLASGDARMRKMILFLGETGNNGKTVLTNLLQCAIGYTDGGDARSGRYTGGLPVSTLYERQNRGEIDVGLVAIDGKRCMVAVEPNDSESGHGDASGGRGPTRRRFDDGICKALSGLDVAGLVARVPHSKELLTVRPGCKVLLLTNHMPRFSGDVPAWNRFYVVPFRQQFVGARDDNLLINTLLSEIPGFLCMVVEGAKAFYAAGALPVITDVQEEVNAARFLGDPVEQWAAQRAALGKHYESPFTPLYEDYKAWLRETMGPDGEQQAARVTQPWFSGALDKLVGPLGLPTVKHRTKRGVVYCGIRLAPAGSGKPGVDEDGVSTDPADTAEDEVVNAARASARTETPARKGGGGAPPSPRTRRRPRRSTVSG